MTAPDPRPTLLALGDSLVEYGPWDQLLPAWRSVNLGRAGETVAGLAARLAQLPAVQPPPQAVLVMSGTNDLAMDHLGFLPAYEEILRELGRRFPAARLVASGLFPLPFPWLAPDAVPRLNALLAGLTTRAGGRFADPYPACLTPAGTPDPACFLDDGVHLAAEGYRRWAGCLAAHLDAGRPR